MIENTHLSAVLDSCYGDMETLDAWTSEIYQKYIGDAFENVNKLYESMKTYEANLTDADINWILVSLPLKMFAISESLNKLRLQHEVVKLRQKEYRTYLDEQPNVPEAEREAELAAYKIAEKALGSVIQRVENEISFCKELIMGAKKIFDSRRSAEQSMPVDEGVADLPDYTPMSGKTYIK